MSKISVEHFQLDIFVCHRNLYHLVIVDPVVDSPFLFYFVFTLSPRFSLEDTHTVIIVESNCRCNVLLPLMVTDL